MCMRYRNIMLAGCPSVQPIAYVRNHKQREITHGESTCEECPVCAPEESPTAHRACGNLVAEARNVFLRTGPSMDLRSTLRFSTSLAVWD